MLCLLPCTGGRTAEHALGFVGLSRMGSAWALWFVGLSHMGCVVCGPVSHGLWGLWACLAWALGFVGLSHMGSGGCGPAWALGFVGLSHMGSGGCGPTLHGLCVGVCLTWAVDLCV